jgi:hypothetical protein
MGAERRGEEGTDEHVVEWDGKRWVELRLVVKSGMKKFREKPLWSANAVAAEKKVLDGYEIQDGLEVEVEELEEEARENQLAR